MGISRVSVSQTQLKTPYFPDTTDNQQRTRTIFIPHPIPFRITSRSMLNQRQATKYASIKSVDRENKRVQHKRALIIGDSTLKGINTKNLNNRVNYVQKAEQTSVIRGKNYTFMT